MSDVPLREHLEALIAEADKRYAERFEAQERALTTAEEHAQQWRNSANEWRSAMTDRERNFLSRGMGNVLMALSILAALLAIAGHFLR